MGLTGFRPVACIYRLLISLQYGVKRDCIECGFNVSFPFNVAVHH